jgi:16S rRNA (cytosine1402-N4)-methyltransferase
MSTPLPYHIPVMGKEVVQWLVTDPNGDYADFTAGGGGHIRLILERLAPSGRVCGIDRDPEAIAEVRRTCPHSIELWNIRFSEACRNISTWSSAGLSGVLLDFGVSSRQLDSPSRGFSYRNSGPLDLRMNPAKGEDAASLLARLSEREIIQLLRQYGEEPQAARIGKAIFRENSLSPIRSTDRLAEIVRQSVPVAAHKALPRVFQSLRIAVNQEIEELNMGLEAAWEGVKNWGQNSNFDLSFPRRSPCQTVLSVQASPCFTFGALAFRRESAALGETSRERTAFPHPRGDYSESPRPQRQTACHRKDPLNHHHAFRRNHFPNVSPQATYANPPQVACGCAADLVVGSVINHCRYGSVA